MTHPISCITGTTRLYGLIGDPLRTARSPRLLNELFLSQGVDAVCVPMVVPAGALESFVRGARAMRNLSGVLVTMPHKQRVLEHVDELHPTAGQVGAANVIRCEDDGRWIGANFDGVGCVLGLEWEGRVPTDKSVLLIGAGGSGSAIAFAIASAGARTLTIVDIDRGRAEVLARSVAMATGCKAVAGPADPRGCEIVINATALGMNEDDALPVNPEWLEPDAVVVDIVTRSTPTRLRRAASARGCRTQDGRPMHEGQAVHALRFLGYDYAPPADLRAFADLRRESP